MEKIKRIVKTKEFREILLIIITFLTLSVFCLSLNKVSQAKLIGETRIERLFQKFYYSLKGFNIAYIPMFVAFYSFYKKNYFDGRKINIIAVILSIFFAISMVLGYSFMKKDSWILVFGSNFQLLKSIIVGLGYYCMFYILIKKVYILLDNYECKSKGNKVLNYIFEKRPFIAPVLIILLCWLPYIILFYPGTTVRGDTRNEIYSFYHMRNGTVDSINLLSEDVYINNHHPVAHVVLVGSFIKLGEFLNNYNLGMFLYNLLQTLLTVSVLGYTFVWMKKNNTPIWLRVTALLIYSLISFMPLYAINCGKATYSAILTLLFIIMLMKMCEDMTKIKQKKFSLSLIVVMLLLMLFRNDGIYRIIIPFIFLIFMNKKYWKNLLIVFLIPICIFEVYSNILLPVLKISKGSVKEMLSVPFQQTARVINKYGNETFSEEEKETINKILDYDNIGKWYNPVLSDPVKDTFKKQSSKEDLKNYFKVWFKNFFKYPTDYIQATLNNSYAYIYPNKLKTIGYTKIWSLDDGIFNIQNVKEWEDERNALTKIHYIIRKTPVIGMLYSVGFYTWVLLIEIGYVIYSKKYKYVIPYLPLVTVILVGIVSPVNGHVRYALPLIFSFPLMVAVTIKISKKSLTDK